MRAYSNILVLLVYRVLQVFSRDGTLPLCLCLYEQLNSHMHTSNAAIASASAMQVHLLNKPQDAVCEMLEGLVASVPHLQRLDGFPEARCEASIGNDIVRALVPVY